MPEISVAADQLRLFIERIERLQEEQKGLSEDIRNVFAEAKANGYDTKTMRAVLRLRKLETHTRQEQDALIETYRAALGMEVSEYARVRAPQATEPTPIEQVIEGVAGGQATAVNAAEDSFDEPLEPAQVESADEVYAKAIEVVRATDQNYVSPLLLSGKLRTTYEGADAFLSRMEAEGIVGPPDAMCRRTVLDQPAVTH